MTKNWIAINLALCLAVGLLSWRLWVSVGRFRAENDIAKIQPVQDLKQRIAQDAALPAPPPPRQYAPERFNAVSDQNLFSETRAREEKAETPVVQEVPPMTVRPVLVGVTISGDRRLAMIVDPTVPAGPGRKFLTKRLGDSFQNYTITDITPNQIVLEYGPRREIIPLFDGAKHSEKGGKTAIMATRVVNFGGGPRGGGPAGTGAQAASVAIGARPPGTPGGQASIPSGSAAQTALTRGAGQQARQVPGAVPVQTPPVPPGMNERLDDQGRRVIRTPFGDIVRPPGP